MTDRDHFAAAALAGLLAGRKFTALDDAIVAEAYAEAAYGIADAMLRERANHIPDAGKMVETPTNLDAAPAAIASVESVAPQPTTRGDSDRTDKAAPRPSEGTGDTPKPISGCVSDRPTPIASEQEPVAWGVVYPNDEVAVIAFKRQDAEERATASDRVVPLYRSPTLTDAEREAVLAMACYCDTRSGLEWARLSATLRGLLERLSKGTE